MTSIRSRRVLVQGEVRPATIRFEGGRIVHVGDVQADHDYGDLVILPGLVDSHVHVNEPGRTEWEGFATATAAAIRGGTTTIVDMPLNSVPPTTTVDGLAEKRRATGGKLSCDVAFWGGVVPGSEDSIEGLAAEGVCGFKLFMVDSGVPEFPPLPEAAVVEVVNHISSLGLPALVHAELADHLEEWRGDPRIYASYLATRPGAAEAAAIARLPSGAHVLHVAGAEAVGAIRNSPSGLSAETCPHYLTFAAEEIRDGATSFKCAPPIRSGDDREALWEGLADGTLGMVVSDHSPAPPDLKSGDFETAWGGIGSVELRLMATWTGARRRGHTFDRLAEWLAAAPARLAGLDDRKGSIGAGRDADFVVFDPDGMTEVDAKRLAQRHPVTPYDGLRLDGRVVEVWLRGRPARSSPPGRLLRRGGQVG